MILSESQIERWRSLYDEFQADAQQVDYFKQLDDRRLVARQEMVAFLNSYLTDQINSTQFKQTFDTQTRKNWNCFGFKGMSGAMFLNKLVNHIPDSNELSEQLRSVLRVPDTVHGGQKKMRAFFQFVEGLISSNQATKQQIQPARTPFFVSAWWHLQSTELWPVFYPRTRQSLELDGLYVSTEDPINDYFTFRETYVSLAKALGITSWDLEHLFVWERGQNTDVAGPGDEYKHTPPTIINTGNSDQFDLANVQQVSAKKDTLVPQKEEENNHVASGHTHIQWLLAKIGQRLGCKVWIASNDQHRAWEGERLGDLSINALPPLWMDPEFQKTISLIDILWLKNAVGKGAANIVAAFEIEHTTSIYSGLLRMSDLVTSFPAIGFPLYIVTPQARLDSVRHELSRPTFQALELHKKCGFFSEEQLIKEADNIMKWAASPSAIEKLASRVEDVEG